MTSDLSRVAKMFLALHNVILNIISPEAGFGAPLITRASALKLATWALRGSIMKMSHFNNKVML